MSVKSPVSFNKATVVPLDWVEGELPVPFALIESVSIENVSGSLKFENFELWREHLSKLERDDLTAARIALVDRFFSLEHVGRNEQQSADLIYKVFLALRVVKPTRTRYSSIQYKTLDGGAIDVFSVAHPQNTPINTPDAESLNRVGAVDMLLLREILPSFLNMAQHGPEHLQRAVRYYETAYSQIHDPVIQFLTWASGIEAVVSENESPKSRSQILGRIYEILDRNALIYGSSALSEFLDLPKLSIVDVLPEIFKLRSRIVHGGRWPDWKPELFRTTLTGERIGYAGILREAAPFVLRKLIVASLAATGKMHDS
jgi:hypothetical protein